MYKQPTEEDILKWTAALRSGEYIKGTGTLKYNDTYCPLGVACEIFKTSNIDISIGIVPDNLLIKPFIPDWLVDISRDFNKKTGIHLWLLSDGGYEQLLSFSFDEIADLIELVYVHKILD